MSFSIGLIRRLCVWLLTLSSFNISGTNWPILIKFYQKRHCGGGKAELGFGQDQIGSKLVSMATDDSHRVIIGKTVLPFFSVYFSSDQFIHAGNKDMYESSEELEVRPDPTTDCGVSCH